MACVVVRMTTPAAIVLAVVVYFAVVVPVWTLLFADGDRGADR